MLDITGKKFNKLTAVKFDHFNQHRDAYWLFRCDCGKEKISNIQNVTRKNQKKAIKSCGCLALESARRCIVEMATTHSMSRTKFYKHWMRLFARCKDVRLQRWYKDIKVCVRWGKFENFRDDMYGSYLKHVKNFGEKQTEIDRVDSKKDYSNSNCKWSTRTEQLKNRGNTLRFILNKKTFTIHELSVKYNKSYRQLYNRLTVLGWAPEKAIV